MEESKTELNLSLNKSAQLIENGLIKEGFKYTLDQLNEITKEMSQEQINTEIREECLNHPIANLLLQEPMTKWSNKKPRGYSGDAILIDYMYRLKSCDMQDSYLGRELYGHLSCCESVSAVRWRANHIANEIDTFQEKVGTKIDIFSVASGHLRELAYISDADHKINRFLCLDQDERSNNEVKSTYENFQFLEIIDESINHIYKRKLEGQKFDFIYSSGLFDYLNDKLASRMIEILYENLKEGGQLIIPNFKKGIEEKIYMDTFMKWNLIYRNEEDMLALSSNLNIPDIQKEIYFDDLDKVVYLKITK